jgi:hypothetical protein
VNSIDLDSDNDGIPDNIEAQATATYIAPGTFTDANNNGLYDGYESVQGGTDILPVDTDGDGTLDFRDTNSDGDSTADIDESGLGAVGTIQANGLGANVGGSATYTSDDINGLAHDGSNFSLADTDNDTNANGTNANPSNGFDFDYRDAIVDIDTDGDMVFNRFDIDDDNDGILDIQEGDLVYAIANNNTVISYPSTKDFISQTNDVVLGIPVGGWSGANNAIWMGGAANQIYAMANNGAVISYPTIIDFVNNTNETILGTPGNGWDGSNNVYWMGASETLYAIANNGAVISYPTITDFVNQSNETVLGIPSNGWNGNSNDVWMGETGRVYGIAGSNEIWSWPSITDFVNQTNVTVLGTPDNGWSGSINRFWAPAFNDWDGDSIPNILDLDSDNDGVPDNIEAQATATYIVPGTFTDIDGDGLHDSYDADTDVGTTTMVTSMGLTPVNTDGIDADDYLDTDADNDGTFDIIESGLANNDADNDGMTDGAVGVNGLDDDASIESTDDYTDINGLAHDGTNFNLTDTDNDTHIDGANADPSTGIDFDYRDAIDSYKVFMRHGKFFRGGTKKKMEFGKRN